MDIRKKNNQIISQQSSIIKTSKKKRFFDFRKLKIKNSKLNSSFATDRLKKIKNIFNIKNKKFILSFLFILFLILPVYFIFFSKKSAEASWWDESWFYRKSIVINSSQVAGDLVNFPMLVSFTDSDLVNKAQTTGNDIVFVESNGRILNHEIEKYDSAKGELIAWVKIPELDADNDSVLYMYYGNQFIDNQQKPKDVWDENYKVVQHLEENPGDTAPQMIDSTRNNKNGTSYGTMTVDDSVSAKIGKGINFDGTDDSINHDNLAIENEYTAEAWVKADTLNGAGELDSFGFTVFASSATANYPLWLTLRGSELRVWTYEGTSNGYRETSGSALNTNDWFHIAVVATRGGESKVFVNGEEKLSFTNDAESNWSSIFTVADLRPNRKIGFDGKIEEVRVSNNIRSSSWISTEYNNQNSPLTFISIGQEEKSPAPVFYLSLDEGFGTIAHDESSGKNNGTINGATWKNEDECVSGKCLGLTSGNSIVAPDSSQLDFGTDDFTISAWALNNDYTYPKSNFMIKKSAVCFTDGAANAGFDIGHGYKLNGFDICIRDGLNNYVRNTLVFDSNFQPSELKGRWTHYEIVFSRSSGKVLAYINGVKQSNELNISTVTGSISNSSALEIGTLYGWVTDGKYDDIKIYAYARSADQVKQDYNAGLSGVKTSKGTGVSFGESSDKTLSDGLLGYWKIDKGGWNSSTGEVKDVSSSNKHGNSYGSEIIGDRLGGGEEALKLSTNNQSLLLDYKVWKDGQTGSVTGFNQNGSTSENYRILDKDPWGRKVPVWEARPDAVSGPDGGWVSPSIAVDQTKMYRFSVWIRRTVLGNGSYYIGTNGINSVGSNFGVLNRSTGAVNTNPYFRSASGAEISSADSWFLLVGHVWPVNSGTGSSYVDTGLYNAAGTKIATPIDFVWQDGTARATHRSYLYYSTDINTRQQWVYPRLDAIDGTEPSIQDLLNGFDKYGNDLEAEISGDKESFSFWYDHNSGGTWEHIVKSSGNYYVNGEPSTPSVYPIHVTEDDIFIGRTASSDFVNGSIDEVRVYNRTLSADEVKKLYEYAAGPVLHLKMDEKAGTTAIDNSGNNRHGTLVNEPTWEMGKTGSALNFNGSTSYVDIDNFDLSGAFTMEYWYKNKSNTDAGMIIGEDSGGSSSGPKIGQYDGKFFARVNSSSDYSISLPSANEWHHVAWTRDAIGKVDLRIDGGSANRLFSDVAQNGTYSVDKIASNGTVSQFFKGTVDDVKIYNYARTQEQILEDMGGNNPAIKSPVLDLSFDEGQGNTVYDKSVNKKNGTLNPGAGGANTAVATMWDKNGKFGGAMEFDGVDDYVSFSPTSLGNNISLSVWINAYENVNTYAPIIEQGGSRSFRLIKYANRFCFGNDNITNNFYCTENIFSSFNTWYHLLAIDDGNYHIFVNGVEYSLTQQTDSYAPWSTNQLNVGYRPYTVSVAPLNGLIDELKIYNYALGDNEIKTLYNQSTPIAMGGAGASADNDGTVVTGEAAKYCIPGDSAKCDAPKLELKMDEKTGTTTYDTSGNGKNATLTNGPFWDRGKIGNALKFDGIDDYLSIQRFAHSSSGVTLNAWIKTTSTDSAKNYSGNAAQNVIGDNTNSVGMGFGLTGGKIQYSHYNTGWNSVTGISSANDGIWHHISATHDSNGKVQIYLDGKLDNSGTISPMISRGFNRIGGGYENYITDLTGDEFNGIIDQVQIYDYARTPAQIAWDYNRGEPIAHWRFDEGEGMIAHDEAVSGPEGNGNDGALTNMDAATDWVDGKNNKALDFDGVDDYVTLSQNITIPKNNSAVSWWMKRSNSRYESIFSRVVGGSNGQIDATAANGIRIESYTNNIWNISLATNINTTDSSWHQYSLVFGPSSTKLFVDGILASTGSANSDTVDFVIRYIGAQQLQPSYGAYFTGQIDDVKIYNYALTEEQVKQDHNSGAVNFR